MRKMLLGLAAMAVALPALPSTAMAQRYDGYRGDDGRYTVPGRRIAAIHRLNIGTITGDGTISLKYRTGARIGSIEERFIAVLSPGQAFLFCGGTVTIGVITTNCKTIGIVVNRRQHFVL